MKVAPEITAVRNVAHRQLVDRARRWLKASGCKLVLAELVAESEIPDVIGWRGETSMVVECKTSRADFRADAQKPFRLSPESGMGQLRYYFCPLGVIRPEDLPPKWGLLYVDRGKVTIERGPDPTCWPGNFFDAYSFKDRNSKGETRMLLSAVGRMRKGLGVKEFERLIHRPYFEPKNEPQTPLRSEEGALGWINNQ